CPARGAGVMHVPPLRTGGTAKSCATLRFRGWASRSCRLSSRGRRSGSATSGSSWPTMNRARPRSRPSTRRAATCPRKCGSLSSSCAPASARSRPGTRIGPGRWTRPLPLQR
ncbi:MAG: Transcriptional regulator, LysR family, partial [uncultured Acetobacteraceae bacterium]